MVVSQWDRNHFNTVEDINISLTDPSLALSPAVKDIEPLSDKFFKCYVQTYSYSAFSVFLGNMRECSIIFSFWFAHHSRLHAQSDIVTRFSACVFAINSKWKLKNLETLFMIFDPQLFHHLNRPGPLDQWVKIFSFLVSFSPRYSNFSESSPSIKLRGVKFRTVSYCAESINKICSERSIILPGASLKLGDFLKFYCKALSIRSSESRHDSSWKVGGEVLWRRWGKGVCYM